MTYSPDYATFVQSRLKDGGDILKTVTPAQANLLHLALGAAGEVGELVDAIKKHVIYNKSLDVKNIDEECGDMLFFISATLAAVGLDEAGCKRRNIEKLTKRYASGYSDKAAQERKDKA